MREIEEKKRKGDQKKAIQRDGWRRIKTEEGKYIITAVGGRQMKCFESCIHVVLCSHKSLRRSIKELFQGTGEK